MALDLDVFPKARSGSVLFYYRKQVFIWGGMTQVMLGEGGDRFIVDIDLPETEGPVLEILNLENYEWRRQITTGDVPSMGCVDVCFYGSLYKLDLTSFTWTKLSTHSHLSNMSGGGTVVHGTGFIMFGGVGEKFTKESRYGANFKVNKSFGYTFHHGWNNYCHEYNTLSNTWTELDCIGEFPPPSCLFTFNKIDPYRALLFGGSQDKYTITYNFVYIYHLETKEWVCYGETDNQVWPCPRRLHVAACLVNPESILAINNQRLLIMWGQDRNAKHVNDAWILHVQSMTWKKFLMPESLIPRMHHMACSYHIQDSQTDVIVFGGNIRRQSKFERNVVTLPIIFRFGSVQPLLNQCINFIRENFDVELCSKVLPPSLQKKLWFVDEAEKDITIIYSNHSS